MKLTIHRGSQEIGGSCVELATDDSRILIDAGLPLPDGNDVSAKNRLPKTLASSLTKKNPPLKGILISHPHQDHYGLLEDISQKIPVYTGRDASKLIKLSFEMQGKHDLLKNPTIYKHEARFVIGDFRITPYLVDHSGFDSYAFLIESKGNKLFYTGDFRDHGKKGKLTMRIPEKLPPVDVLLIEGTHVGQERASEILSEGQLKNQFIENINNTEGIVFVSLSSMNIDRLVILYKACAKTKRELIIDPYTAEILDRLRESYISSGREPSLPHPSFKNIHVCYPDRLCKWMKRNGNDKTLKRHLKYGKKWDYISKNSSRIVMQIRPSSTMEIFDKGYFDLSKAKWINSMWEGYLKNDKKLADLNSRLRKNGVVYEHLHTSGHASIDTLKKLAETIKYKSLIPIHTSEPVQYKKLFENVKILSDGDVLTV